MDADEDGAISRAEHYESYKQNSPNATYEEIEIDFMLADYNGDS